MRLNQEKIEKAKNMFREIKLDKCPIFREEAEKVLALLERMQPYPFAYKSKEQFTRQVVVEYWAYYDSLETQLGAYPQMSRKTVFGEWFVKKATDPDHIQRAVRWLTEKGTDHEYVILDLGVAERARGYSQGITSAFSAGKEELK